jgi:hypothetical protein
MQLLVSGREATERTAVHSVAIQQQFINEHGVLDHAMQCPTIIDDRRMRRLWLREVW